MKAKLIGENDILAICAPMSSITKVISFPDLKRSKNGTEWTVKYIADGLKTSSTLTLISKDRVAATCIKIETVKRFDQNNRLVSSETVDAEIIVAVFGDRFKIFENR